MQKRCEIVYRPPRLLQIEIMNNSFSQKRLQYIPPEKGSFPLDHEGHCKKYMLKYFSCLRENRDDNSQCREESKSYLNCRMENGLMAKESWEKLGFKDENKKIESSDK
jgi:cytochrome c oxidase assembly protein subunit 19